MLLNEWTLPVVNKGTAVKQREQWWLGAMTVSNDEMKHLMTKAIDSVEKGSRKHFRSSAVKSAKVHSQSKCLKI